ncbi:MAG: 2-C-methyl-D-erythritol 2,4-cyclodiphosphate synthase [candidate division Zixibacteria bacterium]
MRIGQGYDVHRLVSGRKLILGGVEIEYELGLDGHSDADVVVHAVIDALLGAAAMGDIGFHFPDTDPAYKNADSIELLRSTRGKIETAGYFIGNIDVTVIVEKPKMAPYVEQMRKNIADAAGISFEQVSVKATTNENIGSIGRGEGIAALAVALLRK